MSSYIAVCVIFLLQIIDCEICEAVYIPVVDGSFIEAPVEDIIKQQRYQKVPYIIGLCQKEYGNVTVVLYVLGYIL